MDVEEYRRRKSQLEELTRRAERAVGAQEEVLRRLRAEHGCPDLAAAEKMLKKVGRELGEAEKEYEEAGRLWDKQWLEKEEGGG